MIKPILYLKSKVKYLCYLSAMLGYKYTTDWIIDHIPEASYLIQDYLKKHPDARQSLFTKYFKSPDNILQQATNRLDMVDYLEENDIQTDETEYLKSQK